MIYTASPEVRFQVLPGGADMVLGGQLEGFSDLMRSSSASGTGFQGLGPGASGPRVERLQKVLAKWNPKLGVQVNGKFDDATRKATALYRAIYTDSTSGPVDAKAAEALNGMEDGTFWQNPPAKTPTQAALYKASRSLGTPYRMGGDGVSGTDCGMFTSGALKAAGVSTTRLADDQYRQAREGQGLSFEKSGKPGDLVFFRVPTSQSDIAYGGVTHVGLNIGQGLMMAASTSAGKVVIQETSDLGSYIAGYGRPQGGR